MSNNFTCPMHPEIKLPLAGDCPKCGMALEQINISYDSKAGDNELKLMTKRFIFAAIFGFTLLIITMTEMFFRDFFAQFISQRYFNILQFLLASPVCIYSAKVFYQRGYNSIINKSPNMYTLISLGVITAYSYSVIVTFFPLLLSSKIESSLKLYVYFESATIIVCLVLLGEILELRARHKTGAAIKSLLELAPTYANKLLRGVETKTAIADLLINDRLIIRPGEKIPIDGVVIKGQSRIDESMLTGEHLFKIKKKKSKVYAATINLDGVLTVRVVKKSNDTIFQQIIDMVMQASRSRSSMQSYADKVANYFVPIVIIIAIITFFAWLILGPGDERLSYAIVASVSVLIIACPCALGLATPLSIMVAMGVGAKLGVLFKNSQALESLAKIDTLVIDKTGTLTYGKPKVSNFQSAGKNNELEILKLLSSLEQYSEHPIAAAVLSMTEKKRIIPEAIKKFRAFPGLGVSGVVKTKKLLLGNELLMTNNNVDLSSIKDYASKYEKLGSSVIYLSINNKFAALIVVNDIIKPSSSEIVKFLAKQKIDVILLSGDNIHSVEEVAIEIGISNYFGQMLPLGKAEYVKNLKRQNKIVAMAGDGINDAPALSHANIGIALSSGSDIAIEAADITLLRGDLNGIKHAILLSRKTMGNIYQNLFFAFFYNGFSIPIAAGVFFPLTGLLLNPMIAALLMSLSSLSVVLNSLRLNKAVNLNKEE